MLLPWARRGTISFFIMPSHHLALNGDFEILYLPSTWRYIYLSQNFNPYYEIVIFKKPLPQQSSFVSPLSQLGFGILNTNELLHESPTLMSSPNQILYENECHYEQPHQYQTPGDCGPYSQPNISQEMSLFASNQDGQDKTTISYANENLAFGRKGCPIYEAYAPFKHFLLH
ncbi:hypothetical protein O181_072984 [Austropuccinia psidii MF-1]|uniref:Uncharacterized protein n=1 Tax=Austropuccinia psidii MF-1 TaxID=1389203 RepID=A0A9Q3F685_9BASI|nr:hypothetical protein [Austropuccinia psidii MF-1]